MLLNMYQDLYNEKLKLKDAKIFKLSNLIDEIIIKEERKFKCKINFLNFFISFSTKNY